MLRVQKISIVDTFGIEKLVLRPGTLTIISGENGVGKSSVLDAIRALFEGGYHPQIVRHGSLKSIVSMELSNGITITRTTTLANGDTPGGFTLKLISAEGLELPKPQQYVDRLADQIRYDPLTFITAPAKDRARILLEAMPITFSPDEVQHATNELVERFPDPLTLDQLGQLHVRLFNERTATNRQARDAEGTIRKLEADLPGKDVPGYGDDPEAYRAEEAKLQNDLKIINSKLASFTAQQNVALADEIEYINQQAEAAKDEARKRIAEEIRKASQDAEPQISKLTEEIGRLRATGEAATRVAGTKSVIKSMTDNYHAAVKHADGITKVLENLHKLRQDKLASLPIEGAEVREGKLLIGGLDFETQLNTARQMAISFEIAALKAGGPDGLNFLIADNMEHLDSSMMHDFIRAAKESDWQIVATRVTDAKQLTIEQG